MITLVLWALCALVVVLARWSSDDGALPPHREQRRDFWLWEHEPTREVSHE